MHSISLALVCLLIVYVIMDNMPVSFTAPLTYIYIVKLGFTEVNFFLSFALKHRSWGTRLNRLSDVLSKNNKHISQLFI